MSRKKWIILGVVGIVLCAFAVPLLLFFQPWLLNPFMPLYAYKIIPSAHEGYSRHTLTRGDTVYVSDYEEYGLSTPGTNQQIGQTSLGGRIYTIPGQEGYVVLYDFMSPVGIFRNSQQPVFDWRAVSFSEMRLYPLEPGINPTGAYKDSMDPQLIQEFIATFKSGSSSISPSQDIGNYTKYALYLYSDQLPGLSYCAGVYMNDIGHVYLAENTLSQKWFQASKLFSNWAKSQ